MIIIYILFSIASEQKYSISRFNLCNWRHQQWRNRASFFWSLWSTFQALVSTSSNGNQESISWGGCTQWLHLFCWRMEWDTGCSSYCRKIFLWRGRLDDFKCLVAHYSFNVCKICKDVHSFTYDIDHLQVFFLFQRTINNFCCHWFFFPLLIVHLLFHSFLFLFFSFFLSDFGFNLLFF